MTPEDASVRATHRELTKRMLERKARSDDAIRTLAYNCAGLGAGAIMERAPDVVMPSEQIIAAVDALLFAQLGIEAPA